MMEKYWLWMVGIKGLGTKNCRKLLKAFATPQEVYHASKSDLLSVKGVGKALAEAIISSRSMDLAERNLEKILKAKIKLLTIADGLYPEEVKILPEAPVILYYRGNVRQQSMGVAIVGARRCTDYGKKVTVEAASLLAKHDIPVISGMAKGIDGYAQTACLKAGGYTIGFLGHGVDICYPKEHQGLMESIIENGAVISEYPPGTPVRQAHFPERNYLISAWAHKILIVEADAKSGSLITARLAKEQNRAVFAVPNSIYQRESQGTNRLIADGANIYLEPTQLLPQESTLPIVKPQKSPQKKLPKIISKDEGKEDGVETTELERHILTLLANSNLSVDQLAGLIPHKMAAILESISIMELEGKIKRLPGGKVSRGGHRGGQTP